MTIRQEQINEFDEIHELVKTAFRTANVSNGGEQDYVLSLRASERYIPELALVADEDGKIIGHIMFTKTYISNENGKIEALLLGPLAVGIGDRRKGVGAKLVEAGLEKARALGYGAVFLVGDPAYYRRFGFKSVGDYRITYGMDIPPQYVMALELQADWLKDKTGEISIV
jgi:putative acetyltransferase